MTTLTEHACPSLKSGVRLHFDSTRNQWVLLAPERILALDTIGVMLIKKLNGKNSLSEIATQCAHDYDAELPDIQADILAFAQTLMDKHILHL